MSFRAFPLIGALLLIAAQAAWAVDDGQVLLRGADGIVVTIGDVQADAQRMPEAARSQAFSKPEQVRQMAENIYLRRVLAARAERAGLQNDARVQAALIHERERVLAEAMLAQQVAATGPAAGEIERQARASYDANPDRFKVEERVRASHILIAFGDDKGKARAKADEVLKAARAPGADFAALAKEHSADPGSAARGGELGLFPRGRMVKPFDDAAFGMTRPGQISDLVESQFGFHILRLDAREPAGVKSFEEVRAELVAELQSVSGRDTRRAVIEEIQKAGKADQDAIKAFSAAPR